MDQLNPSSASGPTERRETLAPNRPDIDRHLFALFQPSFVASYPDALIEIALADPQTDNGPNIAELFSVFELNAAGAYAEQENRAGRNVYVGAALRKAGTKGRANVEDVLASSHTWADFDDEGDLERVDAVLSRHKLQASMTVVTGKVPHTRFQPYVQTVGNLGVEQLRAVNEALHRLLGGDAIHSPEHLMRLAGTINYPPLKKRERGRVPELTTLYLRKKALAYRSDYLIALSGSSASAGKRSSLGFTYARTDDELEALLDTSRIEGKWHNSIRAAVASMVGRGWSDDAIRMTCRQYCRNGYGDHDLDALIDGARTKWDKPNEAGPGTQQQQQRQTGEPISPVDLWARFDPPELPKGLLPKEIEEYAFKQGEAMGVDPGGVAMAALAVCAAAIPDRIKLLMKPGDDWAEAARLWVGLVGMPSAKKSPIVSATLKPLARLDAELLRNYLFELQLWEQLDKDERKIRPKPVQKRLRLEDTTIEAAQEALAGSPNGVLLVQDELSGFFGSMDKYSGHRGAAKDRGFWQSYNGGQYALNRVGRGAGIIPNLSVSLLGGIQPDVIGWRARVMMTDFCSGCC